jgi:hypothetical protein
LRQRYVDSLVALPEMANKLSGIKGGSQIRMELQEVPGFERHSGAEKKRMVSRHMRKVFSTLQKRSGLVGGEHASHA